MALAICIVIAGVILLSASAAVIGRLATVSMVMFKHRMVRYVIILISALVSGAIGLLLISDGLYLMRS